MESNNTNEKLIPDSAPTETAGGERAASGAYRGRSRLAAIIALFLLIYIPSTFNWFSGSAVVTDILRDGSLYEALHTEAIVIRNEELIYAPADGFLLPAVNDGDRVAGNSIIATVYSMFSYELMDEYEKINQRLLREQYEALGQNAGFLQEVDKIENDITNAIRKMIPEVNRNSLYDVSIRADTINRLLVKRAEAYGTLETDDPGINQLKEEKQAIEKAVAEGSDIIKSSAPGHLSFMLDGLEQELTPESIQSISSERFSGIASSSDKNAPVFPLNPYGGFEVKDSEPFAKVVKDNIYYLAVKTPVGFLDSFTTGDRIRLRIENPYLEIENAEIVAISMYTALESGGFDEAPDSIDAGDQGGRLNPDDEEGLMVIKLTKYLYDFLNARTVSVALIEKYMEGLKIPLKCLRDVDAGDGSANIVLVKGSRASVRKVRILASNDVYAIIESYDSSAPEGRVNRYDTYIRDAINIEDGMALSK